MQNLQDLQNAIFFSCKENIKHLQNISSVEELLLQKKTIEDLYNEVAFLFTLNEKSSKSTDLQENTEESSSENTVEVIPEIPEILIERETEAIVDLEEKSDDIKTELASEQPVSFSLAEPPSFDHSDHLEERSLEEPNGSLEVHNEEIILHKEEPDNIVSTNKEEEEWVPQSITEVVDDQHEILPPTSTDHPAVSDDSPKQETIDETTESKIKLAAIKNVKPLTTLFDDVLFEEKSTKESEESSLQRAHLRLDLNDRIAFTKTLFGGSQADLNETIGYLNSFQTLEEAKEYLSDLYYEKKWEKVDDFAQRLWLLVENKFS